MRNPIIKKNFLLESHLAKILFFKFAKDLPIIDYHCHLSPEDIYRNKQFKSIADVWLSGDHYKWRLMRANGISEDIVTGNNVDEYEKFLGWAKTVPLLVGNPLYHWTALELDRFFQEKRLLCPKNSKDIFENTSSQLKDKRAQYLINVSNVDILCTTDDPLDTLEYHLALKKTDFKTRVLPAFRPDNLVNIDGPMFMAYIEKLGGVVHEKVTDIDSLKRAISSRIDFFDKNNAKLSDHALDVLYYEDSTEEEVNSIFKKAISGEKLSMKEVTKYKTYLLVFLGKEYAKHNWTQQYHIGALRNASSLMFKTLGKDVGNDAIADSNIAIPLAKLLDSLDKTNELPRTIIYTLNPADFEVAITIMQCFQKDVPGKLQFGVPWWFLDNIDGINKQLKALAINGLLSTSVGMLTDSRSFLSYTRHEYYRRLLCNFLAEEVNKGLYPKDIEMLGKIISDICYYNAKNYFRF